ncbi:MAG TPA: PKD domain-containing protein [Puia sp.]|nr:PKD domain-containing protein [Puia sp.]
MGRITLIVLLFTLFALQLSAQSGGYSNLEFVENKGQWDTSLIKFRAEMSSGVFFMQKKGFTVLQYDTSDLRLIHSFLHGDRPAAVTSGGGGKSGGGNKAAAGTGGKAVSGVAANAASSADGKLPVTSKGGSGVDGAPVLHSHSYRVSFVNASDQVEITPDKPLPSYNNYFIGDRTQWVSNCKLYQGVVYKNIYQGIDLHYYTDAGFLKYDIIVHPGADPGQIALKYEGQNKLSIKKNQVLVQTSVGTVKELEPRSYQLDKQGRTEVACSYVLVNGNTLQFKLKNYSPDATLVIDPTEVFCSFTGSKSDNWGYTATYDGSGNFYAGGIVLDETRQNSGPGGNGYLVSPGAYQSTFQGGDGSEGDGYSYDVAIMKFSTNGGTRLYATYLGGSGDEQPHSMICDAQGNLIVTGRTSSSNFPTYPSSLPLFGKGGGFDLFITKFNATGTGLIGSRRLGGTGDDGVNFSPKYVNNGGEGTQQLRLNYGDDGRSEVILDDANNIYLAACTQSSDFPTQAPFQAASGGGQDGVLLKTSPDVGTILFSSYLGGNNSDAAFVLALDPLNNNIYVGGGTMSTDLKGATGSLFPANQGGVDGFVSIVANDGSSLIKTTYFGTTGTDMIYGIEFDKNGFPYITGTTTGVIPVVNSPFNQNNNQASGKQFITKLKPDLTGVVYSANFGPAGTTFPNISPTAFLVDRCENVYVSGWGGGVEQTDRYNNATTAGLVVTSGALKSTTDGADFYFFVLQRNAASQLYGSFFGQTRGNFGDHVDGGTSRFDKQGVIYQAICANCYGGAVFPTTPGVWASTNGTGTAGCNEAAVKISFNFAGVSAGLKSQLDGRGDSLGCVPLTVTFQDTIRNAKSYIWSFGDGSADTSTVSYIVNHTYTKTGTFQVMLIAIDSNSCNISDTVYKNITVKDNKAILDFKYTKVGPCTSLDFEFFNLSTAPAPAAPFGDNSFVWIFGDLPNTPIPAGPVTSTTIHSFPAAGTYNVSLVLVDTNYCNYPDTLTKQLFIATNVKAQFETPATGCAPYLAVFNNTSIAGQQYYWDFGDGTVDSTDRTPPPHLYPNPGTYTITLKVVDSSTCNITDVFSMTITLQGKPTAAFTFVPVPPVPNTPTVFTNGSSPDAIRFVWLFGDGASTTKLTRDTVIHQYNKTDTFQACLVAFNQAGCADTICHPVAVIINPLLDVPNAFTPGRFGVNGIVKVVGFGITHMVFRIYNRWGQMVFQSNDPYIGWDGTYKGVLQPMDVYAYTLEAEYSDGTHASKKGDITLIR